MALYTIMCIYEVPAKDCIEATDRDITPALRTLWKQVVMGVLGG